MVYLYTTQIASEEWGHALHSLCFSLKYILFVFPEIPREWVMEQYSCAGSPRALEQEPAVAILLPASQTEVCEKVNQIKLWV